MKYDKPIVPGNKDIAKAFNNEFKTEFHEEYEAGQSYRNNSVLDKDSTKPSIEKEAQPGPNYPE